MLKIDASQKFGAQCDNCRRYLDAGDHYWLGEDVEDFEDMALDLLANDISTSYIHYCSKCDGADLEHHAYVWNKELDEDDDEVSPGGLDIDDVLNDYEVPDEYRATVRERLRCRNCGYGEANEIAGHFDLNDRAYTKRDIESFYYLDLEGINTLGERYGMEVSVEELHGLDELLKRTPLLAMYSSAAATLYKVLHAHYEQGHAYRISAGSRLYRGRVRHPNEKHFTEDEMWQPPNGKAVHGRYNGVGFPVLYCCDCPDGIPYEISPTKDQLIDVACIVTHKDMHLLDADRLFNGVFNGFVSSPSDSGDILKTSYMFTNFIGECCKHIGYHGVVYNPSIGNDYKNFALFNYDKGDVLSIESVTARDYMVSYVRIGRHQV